ncbi:ATP synthase F1 subunit delta [Pyxidicoccus fallax]|uniref:ATP synthase subunit delta n=1 Tax=Pyxidicoccus fallax TaxID=394095 RepID=A0A848LV66_9BACT|nr:ATP synthase F1 subunit delta [Pyxidicoccus fallax]NMO21947.1 ATP synthase F1 subunit delta [Pyxidicoccus fallax]NPC84510.1 ATP synthase F1 subunit delta [Pyxidicoccus fallax]
MANVSIARRYARALLDVASEAGRTDAVAEQLSAFASIFAKNPELSDVINNPAYTRTQVSQVVEGVMKAVPGGVDPVLASTLRLLVDRNRLPYLGDIARLFGDMADARAGRVRGRVTSAAPLPADALARLQQTLQQVTQRNVILETRVDPSLLGGVSAQVGSILYDGSLRTQLEEMRRELKQR